MCIIRTGAVAFTLAIVALTPALAATSAADDVVARLPREGDAARYEFTGTVLGICGGFVWHIGNVDTLTNDSATVRWTVQERQMWDGKMYRFAALERTFDQQYCRYEAEEEYLVATSAELYGALPGPAFARNNANHYVYAHGPSPSYYATAGDELHIHETPCEGAAIGLVLGRSAEQARQALEDCVGPHGLGSRLDTGWENHPTFGRTWVARFASLSGDDGPNLLVRYSPQTSMPVEVRATSHRLADGQLVEEASAMTLAGWIDGDRPLSPLTGGTPAAASVPLVEWGMYGPTTGELDPFPLSTAREALAETDVGAAFFATHPDALLQYARYSPQYPPTDGTLHPANVPAQEADCQQREVSDQTGVGHPGTADMRWLRTRWADDTGYLYGHAQASGTLLDAGVAATYSDQNRMETGPNRVPTPALGPAWQDLLAAEALVKNMGATGRLVVTVAAPALPTLAWDDGVGLDFPPWLPAHGHAFTGTVGLAAWCTTGTGLDVLGDDRGIAFVDGRLAYTWTMNSDVFYDPNAPVPAWDHPGDAFISANIGGIPWLAATFSLAGLGILGALVIAFKAGLGERIALSLFSRFQPAELGSHPLRGKILAQIQAQPGVLLPALVSALGAPRRTLSYHVRMLERHELVRVHRTWRGLVLHPTGHAGTAIAGVLNRANAREVLELLDGRPPTPVSKVAAALGIHKSRISRLARDLADAGLLVREPAGRALLLSLSEPGRGVLKPSANGSFAGPTAA